MKCSPCPVGSRSRNVPCKGLPSKAAQGQSGGGGNREVRTAIDAKGKGQAARPHRFTTQSVRAAKRLRLSRLRRWRTAKPSCGSPRSCGQSWLLSPPATPSHRTFPNFTSGTRLLGDMGRMLLLHSTSHGVDRGTQLAAAFPPLGAATPLEGSALTSSNNLGL